MHSQKHRRRSIRLKGYDYSQAGAYFVTVVTWQRECLFGEVVDGNAVLNDRGNIHIIRDEHEMGRIHRYIESNPAMCR